MWSYILFHLSYLKDWLSYLSSPSRNLSNLLNGNEESITGKVIIVTGSNSGIGKAAALQLAKREAKVILACRNLDKAEAAKQHILRKVPDADLVRKDKRILGFSECKKMSKYIIYFRSYTSMMADYDEAGLG